MKRNRKYPIQETPVDPDEDDLFSTELVVTPPQTIEVSGEFFEKIEKALKRKKRKPRKGGA